MIISKIKSKVKGAVFGAVGLAHSLPSVASVNYSDFGEGIANEGSQIWENIAQPAVIVIGIALAGSNLLWPEKQKVHWIVCLIVGIGGGMYGTDIYNGLMS